jgi:hypothetical protein
LTIASQSAHAANSSKSSLIRFVPPRLAGGAFGFDYSGQLLRSNVPVFTAENPRPPAAANDGSIIAPLVAIRQGPEWDLRTSEGGEMAVRGGADFGKPAVTPRTVQDVLTTFCTPCPGTGHRVSRAMVCLAAAGNVGVGSEASGGFGDPSLAFRAPSLLKLWSAGFVALFVEAWAARHLRSGFRFVWGYWHGCLCPPKAAGLLASLVDLRYALRARLRLFATFH